MMCQYAQSLQTTKGDEEFMSDLGPANKLMCPDDDSDEDSDGEGPNAMKCLHLEFK